jgi:LmbE family N-acetylglucosaminyl deacetylase
VQGTRTAGALAGRVTVLSPHLDDAVFSLGAAIAKACRSGAQVTVLTVFAGNPESKTAAGWWDRAAGFRSEGEAARARREEDRAACELVGATPVWLPFSDAQYEPPAPDGEVWRAISDAEEGAEVLLLPGFPLSHVDHLRLTRLVLERRPANTRLGLYIEQPYAKRRASQQPAVSPDLAPLISSPVSFASLPTERRDRRAKNRAARTYSSQLPLFVRWRSKALARLLLRRVGLYEWRRGGERLAWLPRASEEFGE